MWRVKIPHERRSRHRFIKTDDYVRFTAELREGNGWSWSGSRRAARGKRVVLVGLSQSCERQTGG
ncbi:MAG: hypothetical protein ACLFSB_06850, partial [Chitinispirillaceae bacterium]